jgi:hypothetical protein
MNDKKIVGISLMLCGFLVLGWQVYEYLRYSFWMPISVITGLSWIKLEWALNPTDWIGVFNILSNIPLSLALVVVGFFVEIS